MKKQGGRGRGGGGGEGGGRGRGGGEGEGEGGRGRKIGQERQIKSRYHELGCLLWRLMVCC